jgi:Outer membrane protein beta-barrel domain
MNLKTILTALIFLTILGINNGQQRFGGAILVGFNAAQLDGDNAAGFRKFGFCGGIRGIVNIGTKSELLVDLLYSQRGSKAGESDYLVNGTNLNQKISLDYIEIPITYQFSDWLYKNNDGSEYFKVKFNGGLSIGRLFSASAAYSFFDNLTDQFNKTDISWVIGVSYFINKHVLLNCRYTSSFNLVFDNKNNNQLTNGLRGYFFNVGLGYQF